MLNVAWDQIQNSFTDGEVMGLLLAPIDIWTKVYIRGWGSLDNNGMGATRVQNYRTTPSLVGLTWFDAIRPTSNNGGNCDGDSGGPVTLDNDTLNLDRHLVAGLNSSSDERKDENCQAVSGRSYHSALWYQTNWIEDRLASHNITCSGAVAGSRQYLDCTHM